VPPRPLPSLGGAVAAAPPKLETPAKLETLPKLETPPKLEAASRFETPSRLETPRPAATPAMVDLNAAVYKLEVRMSESIAMLKLRGFGHDLGGEVRDSEGGVIRVWLDSVRIDSITSAARAPVGEDRRSWTSGSSVEAVNTPAKTNVVIGLDLRLERSDPTQPNHVTITATIRARNTLSMSRRDMKERYEKIHRELQAYLQINR